MNIFKEMALSVYSFKSYKEFLGNKKSKVFGFGVILMLIYFAVTNVIPFAVSQIGSGGISTILEESVPDFELTDGFLWVDDVVEYEDGGRYVYIDTDPAYLFYDAEEMQPYLYEYSQVILVDSEKVIMKNNGEVNGFYFSELDFDFSKEKLMGWVPYIYAVIVGCMVLMYLWMTALFFFGVLFVALLGMIVASCMKYRLTFGQLYLLGIYSRVLPLIIKAIVSFLPFNIPFFFIINFGISLFIIACAIQKMKEQNLQQPLEFTSGNNAESNSDNNNRNGNDFTWMQ